MTVVANRERDLRRLLSGLVSLEGVAPALRRSVRQALAAGDADRMRRVGRSLVGELLAQGELVRVAVEGGTGRTGPLCLVRGTSRLVDVSTLGLSAWDPGETGVEEIADPGGPGEEPVNGTLTIAALEALPADLLNSFSGVLGAMEQAQNLEIGDPRSGEESVILAGIVRLLEGFMPRFRLFIMLPGADVGVADSEQVFVPADPRHEPPWIFHRRPGSTVWIPDAMELPLHVRRTLADWKEPSPADDAAAAAPDADDDGREDTWCAAAVPLREPEWNGAPEELRSHEAGLLFLLAPPGWPRDALLRLARRTARFVSRRWRQQREVNQRIHTDSLTGLQNRAYFDSQFALELERARRSETPLTLILADLDRFKGINDRFGHHAGDRVLRQTARWLQEELRRVDHVCRIGGEEFGLILPHTSAEAAREVMTRLLTRPIPIGGVQAGEREALRVTLSYGMVTFPDAGVDAFELYRKADAMLYLSKDAGRNQCHVWTEDTRPHRIVPPAASA